MSWSPKRCSFHFVDELKQAILRFIEERNATETRPFSQSADPDKIIAQEKEGSRFGINSLGNL